MHVYGDSQLVNDEYKKKDDKLLPYCHMVEDFKQHFSSI